MRVTLIVISAVLLGIILQNLEHGYYYTLAGILFLILLQAWFLVNEVNKTNARLEKFLSSVQDNDSSVRFTKEAQEISFSKLNDKLNQLNISIQNAKIENEKTSQFMQSLVDHVDIGLLSYDDKGKIEIYNRAAQRYLRIQQNPKSSSLEKKNDELFKIIKTIRPGQEILHKTIIDDLLQNILVKATGFRYDNRVIKLISFQDITNELDRKEQDSWQKLIRILTHEIMNSVSPITSLTGVISGYFKKKEDETPVEPGKINSEIIARTLLGLNTIEETGKGLLEFVDKYRSLSSLPRPVFCEFSIIELFRKCKLLLESDISNHIKIIISAYPENLTLVADYSQLEQVLINLINNAVAALANEKNGIIQLKAIYSESGTIIHVEDNGVGISGDIIEDIFVPFYTTRESGSGIGLSLARQIMQNHSGTISVISALGKGAIFTLKFQ